MPANKPVIRPDRYRAPESSGRPIERSLRSDGKVRLQPSSPSPRQMIAIRPRVAGTQNQEMPSKLLKLWPTRRDSNSRPLPSEGSAREIIEAKRKVATAPDI